MVATNCLTYGRDTVNLPESNGDQLSAVVGSEPSPTGSLGYESGEQRELLPVHELQHPRGRVVEEAQEVRVDIEHLRGRTQFGRTHAHAQPVEDYRPEPNGIPAASRRLRSVAQSRGLALTRERKNGLIGLCHRGTLRIRLQLLAESLVPVAEPCVESIVASERRDIDSQSVSDRTAARAGVDRVPEGFLDDTVVAILELPSLGALPQSGPR